MNKKKILAAVHLYPPKHVCGGEFYLHRLLKKLQSEGHEVRVLLLNAQFYGITRVYVYDGIEVYPNDRDVILANIEWATVYMTHLDYTATVIGFGQVYKKPVIHIVHNNHKRPDIMQAGPGQYIIYNTAHTQKSIGYPYPSMVLHPPCNYRDWDDGADHYGAPFITLVNLDGNKGGKILTQIALAMPDKRFLGVTGSYSSPPEEGQHIKQPANVTVIGKTQDMKGDVYARTRILIAPSKYESFGMCASEAMASGIPVISTGTPGLRENCGEAGNYIEDRDNIRAWVEKIRSLEDREAYSQRSQAARQRSRELDPERELQVAADWINEVRFYSLQSERGAVSTVAPFIKTEDHGEIPHKEAGEPRPKTAGAKPPQKAAAKPPAKKATT